MLRSYLLVLCATNAVRNQLSEPNRCSVWDTLPENLCCKNGRLAAGPHLPGVVAYAGVGTHRRMPVPKMVSNCMTDHSCYETIPVHLMVYSSGIPDGFCCLGSKYYRGEQQKYSYRCSAEVEPQPLPTETVRSVRSWLEKHLASHNIDNFDVNAVADPEPDLTDEVMLGLMQDPVILPGVQPCTSEAVDSPCVGEHVVDAATLIRLLGHEHDESNRMVDPYTRGTIEVDRIIKRTEQCRAHLEARHARIKALMQSAVQESGNAESQLDSSSA
eukprot:TRINITY_DN54183_c0_g1_i1.p1 TRINITY_DN54183_c0_g1~~TRINITY_DN54183_c0_g1_i1.p1  ORF type:complete len:272 (-),score=23.51 TRINITY_DN54183_c0_g1_i1:85-900(-)